MEKTPQLLYDRVLVKADMNEDVSEGGIILPKMKEDEDVLRGEVVSVGPGRYCEAGTLIPMTVKVGQTVAFDRDHAASIKLSGVEYFVLDEASIYAILD